MDRRGSTFNLAPPPAARTRTRTALAPPSSAPFSSNSVIDEVARRQRENGQATGGGGGDLISSADSWSMTREREETYRREVEAQIRAEMAMEDEMRAEIEQQVRREAEEEFRREQDKMREDMERKLRREMELSSLRASPKAASLSSTTLTSSGPSRAVPPPPTRRKGHARQHSVTNSARELRGVPKSNPRPSPQMSLRRPLPPPPPSAPPPRPLSPRTVAAIQIQSQVRRWRARRMMKQLRRRVASVAEIWSTEEQYVAKLRLFQSVFFAQIRASESAGLINPSDMGLIFNNWDDVVIYNTELLRQLRARCATFRAAHCVGDIFLGMRHFSSIYSTFLAGYDKALKVVFWHVENNPGMAKVIKQCEKQLGNTIESYLILPVQRIPRYVLLLRATLGETHRDHPDYALCTQAADKMEAVGTAVNERRREYEAEEARHRLLKEVRQCLFVTFFRENSQNFIPSSS